MKNTLLIFTLIAFFAHMAFAGLDGINHIESRNLKTNHGLGFGYTEPVGGFVYRQHFQNRWGLRATGGAWGKESYGWVGTAIGGMYSFFYHEFQFAGLREASTRLYGLGTFSTTYTYKGHEVHKERHTIEPGIGAGIGMDFHFSKHFGSFIEMPFQVDFKANGTGFHFSKARPGIGAALIYYF